MVQSHTVHLPLGALLIPCTVCAPGAEEAGVEMPPAMARIVHSRPGTSIEYAPDTRTFRIRWGRGKTAHVQHARLNT